MIQYSLKCANGHSFDSWFQSASAFDALKRGGHLQCVECGSADVDKAIMAPRVQAARSRAAPEPATEAPPPQTPAPAVGAETPLAAPSDPEIRKALAEMKKQVEANSDYVGEKFAEEARSMHLGASPERSIYGQANAEEAKSLIEDGIPVMPLPFMPTRKTN